MDRQVYHRWWALHRRVALGETLGEQDQAFYKACVSKLDAADERPHVDDGIADICAALAALEAENARLRARNEHLTAEIAVLEKALDDKPRQRLTDSE